MAVDICNTADINCNIPDNYCDNADDNFKIIENGLKHCRIFARQYR